MLRAALRSSGEAEAVVLSDALRADVGVSRSQCTAALPAVDAFEQLLGRRVELRVLVDATVSILTAEKGASKPVHMKHLSKLHQVGLF